MKQLKTFMLAFVISASNIFSIYADGVMIDPGHGGADSGAVSYDNTLLEKDLNLDTAKAIRDELKKHGVTVHMTRTDDEYISLRDRSDMANKIEDLDLFVSIHHNASTDSNVNRGEVIYSVKEKESQRLAECIANRLGMLDGMTIKIYNRYNSKGLDYYSVLRHTNAPSVIVEISFITSEEGVAMVDTPEERRKNGKLVAEGILDYLGVEIPKDTPQPKEQVKIDKKSNKGMDLIDSILKSKNTVKRKSIWDILKSL